MYSLFSAYRHLPGLTSDLTIPDLVLDATKFQTSLINAVADRPCHYCDVATISINLFEEYSPRDLLHAVFSIDVLQEVAQYRLVKGKVHQSRVVARALERRPLDTN